MAQYITEQVIDPTKVQANSWKFCRMQKKGETRAILNRDLLYGTM